MDTTNRKILTILQQNGRISFAELGKAVHLSAPAVAERVKKLEQAGAITGYRATVNPDALGYPIQAMVQAKVFFGKENTFMAMAKGSPAVIECLNVTGEKAFVMKVAVATMGELDALLEAFSILAETNTMVILSCIDSKIIGENDRN